MCVHDRREMGGDDSSRVNHRIAERLSVVVLRGVDPLRGQAERRIGRGHSRQSAGGAAGVDRQIHADMAFALADRHSLQGDAIRVRREFEVVTDVHRRRQKSDLLCKLLANRFDPPQELAVLALVDQRNQPIADLEAEHINRHQVVPAHFQTFDGRGDRRRGADFRRAFALHEPVRDCPHTRRQQQERDMRHTRNQP